MGLLSSGMAIGGAMSGAGRGIEDVAKAQQVRMHDEAMIRLKEDFESKTQQAGIEAQKSLQKSSIEAQAGLQKSGQTFEAGQQQKSLTATSAYHGAALAQQAALEGSKEASATERTKLTVGGKQDVALIKAASAGGGKGAGQPFTMTKVPKGYVMKQEKGTDGKMHDTNEPDFMQPITDLAIQDKRSGAVYAPQGNRIYEWDNEKRGPAIDPKSTNNVVSADEVQAMNKDPYGIIPAGNKGAGSTKADFFMAQHRFWPASFMSAVQRAQQQGAKPTSLQLTGGRNVQVQPGSAQTADTPEIDAPESSGPVTSNIAETQQ
jgi:hypothetical protein